ncbi:MAG: hypothetical protein PHF25_03300 [Candidatus Margulisbacteria bacterium]|nr:hypothetical protein [Candidatus Margulisiibacteriota bacterium]
MMREFLNLMDRLNFWDFVRLIIFGLFIYAIGILAIPMLFVLFSNSIKFINKRR